MRKTIPVLLLTAAGFFAVWQYQPTPKAETALVQPAPAQDPAPGQQPAPAAGARTVAGSAVSTRHGTVQVQVTFDGDRIADVQPLQAPNSNPTRGALPKLRQEALTAQSAQIDTVSGATGTSAAYRTSLQAALDAKGS